MVLAPSGIASHNVFLQMFSCQNMVLGGVHPEELSPKSPVTKATLWKTHSKGRDAPLLGFTPLPNFFGKERQVAGTFLSLDSLMTTRGWLGGSAT